ncbi:ABC transporter ATP-binding protein [Brucella intermedia]|uniref:ABC transporter ATP-binding protein n=1 Tax=Brucella intermedia TaxID=94625 RepID=UPI00224A95D6|nr:ABC transporter ATP-binding protein [Brucella intermedia]
MVDKLLEIENLRVSFHMLHRKIEAVKGVSFSISREKVGIVGESGSGKSLTGRSILRLAPKSARIKADCLRLNGVDLMALTEKQMHKVRGGSVSMILQDPKYSLNPLMRVGRQISEAYRLHRNADAGEARKRSLEMLEAVRIRDPELVYDQFPHELSGGMGQRIMIAMMLIPEPDLIIADEPTSALDVTVKNQVLRILDEQLERRRAGLLFISHDLNLVSQFCDRVLVMYAGRIVEDIRANELFRARHPYTQALLGSLPRLDEEVDVLQVPKRDPEWLNGPTYINGAVQ